MIPVHISKITLYPPSKGYAVLLQENTGLRQLPVIIGAFEAQAIAFALEKVEMPRPMTHDLIVNILKDLGTNLKYIVVSDLVDGTFYAKMRVEFSDGNIVDIDSRPSDAIAIALRFKAPIFVDEKVMDEAGIERGRSTDIPTEMEDSESDEDIKRLIQLQADLQKAIENEEYEKAARIRDEIRKIEEGAEKD